MEHFNALVDELRTLVVELREVADHSEKEAYTQYLGEYLRKVAKDLEIVLGATID